MKAVILLLAAAATTGAAPPRPSGPPSRYEAGGFEPSWELIVDHGRLHYNPRNGAPVVNMAAPPRRAVRNGYRLVSRDIVVDVRHVRCDAEWGRTYVDTVRISGMRAYPAVGCGGMGIAPTNLNYSNWYIHDIAGTHLPLESDDWKIEFREGRITVTVRCQEYSGRYRERRPALTLGALTHVAPPGCVDHQGLSAPAQLALEQRVLAILRGPLRIGWVEGDTLVLTSPRGRLRLFPLA
jgi:hypothetical protein